MPKTTLSDGEWQELAPLTDGDVFSVEPENNPIYVTSGSRGTAGYGQPVAAGEHYQGRATRSETLYARAEDGDATVSWRIEGFLGLFQPPTTQQTNIYEQEVTIEQDQIRQSSEGQVEVNRDQTTSVADGSTDTSTITANAEEVWELQSFYFEYKTENDGVGQDYDVTVESTQEAVEYAYAAMNTGSTAGTVYYRSGGWGGTNSSLKANRENLQQNAVRIDDTAGVDIVFDNFSEASATNTRFIRGVFRVIDA